MMMMMMMMIMIMMMMSDGDDDDDDDDDDAFALHIQGRLRLAQNCVSIEAKFQSFRGEGGAGWGRDEEGGEWVRR